MKKTRNTLKNIIILNFILFVALGIYTNTFQPKEKVKVKEVYYSQLVKMVEENKDKKMELYEANDGTIVFSINGVEEKYTTKVPKTNSINDLISKYNIKYENQVEQKSIGSYISSALSLLLPILVLVFIFTLFSGQKKALGKGESMAKANSKKNDVPNIKFDDVGGLRPETKKEILRMIEVSKNGVEAEKFGIRPTKGVIFYGPPGTGKTLLAKAVANSLGANFYTMSGSSFVEMYVGVGAARVRKLFEEARKNAPSLIFIDEIDAVAGKRGGMNRNEEREATLNELLTQLDGINSNEKVLVMAATNRLDMLDEAFVRPGRFDIKIMIDLPDVEGRKEIINIHTKKKPLSKEVLDQLDEIATSTYGYSGADIEALFLTAANHAFANNKKVIDMEDINHAIDRSLLGSAGRNINDKDTKKRVAYHEAGHAIIGALTKPGSIRKATIVPRGQALGFVAQLPKEMNLQTKSELVNHVSMILAGGVAEIKIFGEHSVGVGGDVQQAKQLIDNMVDLGMTNNDFVLVFDEKDKSKEKQLIFAEALQGCKDMIDKHEAEFVRLAETLLEKETLDGSEVEAIVFNKTLISEEINEEQQQEEQTSNSLEFEEEPKIKPNLSEGNA